MKIHNKRELQNIATNHSADIGNKVLRIFTRNIEVNHILFWLLTLHNQLVNLYDLKNIYIFIIKMTLNDELKVFDNKIKAN